MSETSETSAVLTTPVPIWMTWEGTPKMAWARFRPTPVRYSYGSSSGGSWSFTRRKTSAHPSVTLIHLMRVPPLKNGLHSDGRGIDLAKRGDEVRKLFYAAFARGLVRDGFDPEEALQEVYKGLLSRNRGTCPFDIKKSSFGHYVHIVTRCVLANFVRKEKNRAMYEVAPSYYPTQDGESPTVLEVPVQANQEEHRRGHEYLMEQAAACVPPGASQEGVIRALGHMAEGYTKREAASRAGISYAHLGLVLTSLRERVSLPD